jgi:hypothetical protein
MTRERIKQHPAEDWQQINALFAKPAGSGKFKQLV